MKKFKHHLTTVTLLLALFFTLGKKSPPPSNESDYSKIEKAVNLYIQGGKTGKSKIMRSAFYENASMSYVEDGVLKSVPISALFKNIDKKGPAKNLTGEIVNIDLNRNTALARVELRNWSGARFTDQMTLVKSDNKWKILHKVYYKH